MLLPAYKTLAAVPEFLAREAKLSETENSYDIPGTRSIAMYRLAIGIAQGACLFGLYYANDAHVWPATNGLVFAPLLLIALFAPLLVSLGLGSLRARTLGAWIGVATLALAGAACFAIWKTVPDWREVGASGQYIAEPQIVPPFGVFFFAAVWLLIGHALAAAGDADRRIVAHYHTLFDIAWKLAVQLLLGAAFVGVFWGLLFLGGTLFELIDLHFLKDLIEHAWFAIPATALTVAVAIHLTDVRSSLVRGIRTIMLVLLSWFLPLLVLLVGSFLIALIFTGVRPLWGTGHASIWLLAAAGALVILINALYQDGDVAHAPQRVLRYAANIACFLLAPLVVLAAYSLGLRIAQYGWTADRVATEACIVAAACYAAGYALAALYPGKWLKQIERWNFIAAILILLVLAALFSPLCDPDRIAVASQVDQLQDDRIAPDRFDFDYLRWRSGRYGVDALQRLATSASGKFAGDIRKKSLALLEMKTRDQAPPRARAVDVGANIAVYPRGMKLPADFLKQNWGRRAKTEPVPDCLNRRGLTCEAFILNLASSGAVDIVILNDSQTDVIYEKDAAGRWRVAGRPGPLWTCGTVLESLRDGEATIRAAGAPAWRDVIVKGVHLGVLAPFADDSNCPK
jgi:hypothetical protein